jgi:hypothetical protein
VTAFFAAALLFCVLLTLINAIQDAVPLAVLGATLSACWLAFLVRQSSSPPSTHTSDGSPESTESAAGDS